MAMYFILEENPKFAVFTHFFIYKNIDAFPYLSLYKMKYTYPPYLSAIAHSTGLFAVPCLAGAGSFSLPHYLFHRTHTKLNGDLNFHTRAAKFPAPQVPGAWTMLL